MVNPQKFLLDLDARFWHADCTLRWKINIAHAHSLNAREQEMTIVKEAWPGAPTCAYMPRRYNYMV